MGTYGRVAKSQSFARWCPPEHRRDHGDRAGSPGRFGSETRSWLRSPRSPASATTIVLNVDDARLADSRRSGRSARTAQWSFDARAWTGRRRMRHLKSSDPCESAGRRAHDRLGITLTAGAQRQCGVRSGGARHPRYPTPRYRRAWATYRQCLIGISVATGAERSVSFIDDTYNSNPAGALAALRLLGEAGENGAAGGRHARNGRIGSPPGGREPGVWFGRRLRLAAEVGGSSAIPIGRRSWPASRGTRPRHSGPGKRRSVGCGRTS